jgi:hypothetical protein
LGAQKEYVDVNFIKNNNYNNSRPYPANGNSYGRYASPNEEKMLEIERSTKSFMQSQYEQNKLFTKTMNEQSTLLKNIGNQLENLNMEISGLQTKLANAENRISYMSASQSSLINKMAAKPEDIDNKIVTTANAIQVRINEN